MSTLQQASAEIEKIGQAAGEIPARTWVTVPTDAESKALELLLTSLNSVAQRVQALWITFISFGAYLTMTVLGTTHQSLFLESAVKLPIFNIDLPLTSFYLVAPIFLLIFHFYFLIQLVLLARTASEFEAAIGRFGPTTSEALRVRLDNSIFLQLLAGCESERSGKNSWLIRPIVWLTAIALPVSLFLLFELQFLPYHDEAMTWFHRSILVTDLVILLLLWPVYRRGNGMISSNVFIAGFGDRTKTAQSATMALACLMSIALAVFACAFSTFPTEKIYFSNQLTTGLFERGVDRVTGRPAGYFSNRLVLPDKIFIKDEKELRELDLAEKGVAPGKFRIVLPFRGRDFAFGMFSGADLRRSDFTGANLQGADFTEAILDRSRFGSVEAEDQSADDAPPVEKRSADKKQSEEQKAPVAAKRYGKTLLRDAQFGSARLNWTSFDGSDLSHVTFDRAELEEASFKSANLVGASFIFARMPTVSMRAAELGGAQFGSADMRFANLNSAKLSGASLNDVKLHGASLVSANLDKASLESAQLIGANFNNADLRDAALNRAHLQGATLANAQIDGASFDGSYVWRTNLAGATGMPASTKRPKTGDVWSKSTVLVRPNFMRHEDVKITSEIFKEIVAQATEGISSTRRLVLYRFRLDRLDPNKPVPESWRGWEDKKSN